MKRIVINIPAILGYLIELIQCISLLQLALMWMLDTYKCTLLDVVSTGILSMESGIYQEFFLLTTVGCVSDFDNACLSISSLFTGISKKICSRWTLTKCTAHRILLSISSTARKKRFSFWAALFRFYNSFSGVKCPWANGLINNCKIQRKFRVGLVYAK